MADTILTTKTIKNEAAIISRDFVVPANLKGTIELVINIDPVELLDVSRSFWFHIHEFVNNNWQHVVGARWVGGANYDPDLGANIEPRIWIDAARIAGKTVRLSVDIPKPQKIGLTLILRT